MLLLPADESTRKWYVVLWLKPESETLWEVTILLSTVEVEPYALVVPYETVLLAG